MSNVELVKAYTEDLPDLKHLFMPPNLGYVPWERYVRTFTLTKPEKFEDPYIGLGLKVGDKWVGFLGMVRSFREIQGIETEVNNMSTMTVLPEYRTQSLRLFRALKTLKTALFTCLTPSPVTEKVSIKTLGASVHSDKYQVLSESSEDPSSVTIISDLDQIQQRIDSQWAGLFDEHSQEACYFVLVECEQNDCLLLLTERTLQEERYVEVLFYSDLGFFSRWADKISSKLVSSYDVKGVILDVADTPSVLLDPTKQLAMKEPNLVVRFGEGPLSVPFISLYSEITKMGM